jgi:hypothetical protein
MYFQREGGTEMTVLVAYASKHGSTQGIAERIAQSSGSWGSKPRHDGWKKSLILEAMRLS